jgi:hypothetical protein
MKRCTKCGEYKPLAAFYTQPGNTDGHAGDCKECRKRYMKHRRLTNTVVQEQDRARYQNPERKRKIAERVRQWNEKYPAAYRAHYTVTNAVRDRRLKKEPCSICGTTERVHGHHKDYSKPLDVTWLCAKCHHRIHATFPELGGHF